MKKICKELGWSVAKASDALYYLKAAETKRGFWVLPVRVAHYLDSIPCEDIPRALTSPETLVANGEGRYDVLDTNNASALHEHLEWFENVLKPYLLKRLELGI